MFEFVKAFLAEVRSLNNNLQKHGEAINEATQAAERNANKTPEVRAILNFPESVQADKKSANDAQRSYQDRNLLLALLTLIALVIYAVTTIFIYCATNRAAAATERAAKAAGDAADEAKRSRIQAEESLKTTIAQSQLDQRAWVGAKAMSLNFPLAAEKQIVGTILVGNSGKTFALKTAAKVWIHISTTAMNQLPHPNAKDISPVVLFPNQELSLKAPFPTIPKEGDVTALKNKTLFLYLYGKISYVDVFGKQHQTDICGIFTGDNDFNACSFHNTAD